jgi:vacuolar protein sorting-associated protein VTA1
VKTIKNGEDPNMTNPVPEEEEKESIATQEVETFDGSVAERPSRPRQPLIEESPEEPDHLKGRELAQQWSLDESLQWPPATSTSGIHLVLGDVPGSPARTKDIGNPQPGDLKPSSTPWTIGCSSSMPNLPGMPGASTFGRADATRNSHALHPFPPQAASSSVAVLAPASFHELSGASSHLPHPATVPPAAVRAPVAHVPAAPSSEPSQSVDDQSISMAQKHAHWALSALTFDDVETAIKEFKNSLRHLGATC